MKSWPTSWRGCGGDGLWGGANANAPTQSPERGAFCYALRRCGRGGGRTLCHVTDDVRLLLSQPRREVRRIVHPPTFSFDEAGAEMMELTELEDVIDEL